MLVGSADGTALQTQEMEDQEVLMGAMPEWQAGGLGLEGSTLVLTLPVKQPDVVVPVIELDLS